MKCKRAFLPALAALALALAAPAQADVVVVVHPRNPVGELTAQQVSQIYMGASNAFPGGAAALPLDQAEGSAARQEFLDKVLEKSAAQFKAVWSRLIFSGKGTKPRVLAGSDEVRKAVAAEPAAIGFIDRAAADASVKVVLTVR
jgi:ABC-type phosphate transport system substrate-binding protein